MRGDDVQTLCREIVALPITGHASPFKLRTLLDVYLASTSSKQAHRHPENQRCFRVWPAMALATRRMIN